MARGLGALLFLLALLIEPLRSSLWDLLVGADVLALTAIFLVLVYLVRNAD